VHRRSFRRVLPAAALALGLATVGLVATSATANTFSPITCLTNCTAVFDTANGTFTSDPAVTQLTATVTGAAGEIATGAGPLAASSVGGPGGSTTVDLGTAYAAVPIAVVVGTTAGSAGSASSIASGTLIAIAGGGGQAGFAGALDIAANQVSATYPGGTGGSPSGPGVTSGTAGTAFGTATENGEGGVSAGGPGGTGTGNNGTAGTNSNGTGIVAGGAGGSLAIASINPPSPTTYTGGVGGQGYAGGGGGAVATGIDGGDLTIESVGAGGGGSGFLASGFTATSGTPNTSLGSVTFTYSFTPTATTTATSVHRGDTIPVVISGLPSNVPFTLVFDGVTVGSGTSDPAGGATISFVVSATQAGGSFPVQVVVGGAVAASTTNVAVVVPALAATGVVVSPWVVGGAALFVVVGILLLVLRRRLAPGRARL